MPAELAKRVVICACMHGICLFKDLMGLKNKNHGHFWLGIFIQDNLPVNIKRKSSLFLRLPISQFLLGTVRKNDQFSLDRSSTCRPLLLLYPCARTHSAKGHGNLNKGAPGSMNLMTGHYKQEAKEKYLRYNS